MVAAPPIAPPASETPLRWTRQEYVSLGRSGVLGERRLELLEGQIYEAMAEGHFHRMVTTAVSEALRAVFGAGYLVRSQVGLPLGERSQPSPDVTVLRGTVRDFFSREESVADAALLVEVVDTRPDTAALKLELYARAEVPEYWIVAVNDREVTVYRKPENGTYRESVAHGDEATLTPLGATGGEIAVADLLP